MSETNNYELVSIGDDIISYILDSYILILTEINEQFLTFYLKNEGECNVIFCSFISPCSVFNVSGDYLENYLLEGS